MVRLVSLAWWYALSVCSTLLVAGALVSGRVPLVFQEPVLVSGSGVPCDTWGRWVATAYSSRWLLE